MRLKFWVLEKGPSYSPQWFRKEPLPHQKRPGVTNILYGDRYASKEEAEANALIRLGHLVSSTGSKLTH